MQIGCSVSEDLMDGDCGDVEGVTAECSRCGHTTESYGTGEASVRRCLALMPEECPEGESNYYTDDG